MTAEHGLSPLNFPGVNLLRRKVDFPNTKSFILQFLITYITPEEKLSNVN